MGILVVSWGIVMTLTGIVQGFGGLIATRVMLGVCEYVEKERKQKCNTNFVAGLVSSPGRSI